MITHFEFSLMTLTIDYPEWCFGLFGVSVNEFDKHLVWVERNYLGSWKIDVLFVAVKR